MAITIIRPEHLGKNAGRPDQTGQALQNLAESLAHNLMQKRHEKQQQQEQQQKQKESFDAYTALGYSPRQINFLNQIDPKEQYKYLLNPDFKPELSQGQQPQGVGPLGNMQQPNENQSIQQLLGGQQQGQGQDAVMQNLMKLLGGQQQRPQGSMGMQGQAASTPQGQELPPFQGFGQYETPQMKLQRELAEKKEAGANQRAIDKANQPYIDEIYRNADKAESQNRILDEMDSVASDPKALGGSWGEYFKRALGLAEGSGTSAAQLYRAYESRLIDGVRGVYGNRIPVEEMKIYARRVPSLLNSPNGRRALSESLRKVNNDEILKKNAANSILEANEGKSTRLFKRDLSKKYNEELNKRAKSFSDDIKKANKMPLGGTMDKKVAASTVPKGTISTDYKTGKKEISDGQHWKPYKG